MNEKNKTIDQRNAFLPPPQVNLINESNDPGITKNLKSSNNFENSNSTSFDYNKKNQTTEVDHLISSDSETKKTFLFQNTAEQNIGTPGLFSQRNTIRRNVNNFVNKLSALKRKKRPTESPLKEGLNKATDRAIILKRFHRSFQIIKVIFRLKRISEDIQTYGTSSNLFDLTTRDRTTVKKVLYPLNEESEVKNVKSDDGHLPFPLLHPKSKIKLMWTPIVVLLLLYTATLMPYVLVFFDIDDNDWSDSWVVFQLIVDLLFWFDLIINMISAYYNEEGILIKTQKEIAYNYLKGWFFIDLIACLPFNYIGDAFIEEGAGSGRLNLMRLSRVPRLYRLIKITKLAKVFRFLTNDSFVMEYFEFNSGIMRLISLLFSVSILIHLMGCLWYYEAKLEDFGPDTWVFRNNMQDNSNLSLYMASIYFALTTLATVGYGDICAKTNTEMITSIVWMLFGVGFYSFTIGILSSVLAYIDTKATNLQKKIAIMNEFCNEMKISKSLKEKLRKTLEYNSQKNSFTWAEKTNIFNDLPINLRYEIVMNVHDKVISEILFFKNCDDKFFVVRTVPLLKPLFMKSKESIWTIGTNPDAIYFLINGRVNYVGMFEKNLPKNFSSKDIAGGEETKKSFIFKSMVSGSYFGEIEILFKRRRDFSVICEMDSELYYLSRYDFENILVKEFPHIVDQMKLVAKKRDKINKQAFDDVALLLKTAKEITFEKKNAETINESAAKPLIKQKSLDNEEITKKSNPFLKNVVEKFKNSNKNKIFPSESIDLTSNGAKPFEEKKEENDSKLNENAIKEPQIKIDESSHSSSRSSSEESNCNETNQDDEKAQQNLAGKQEISPFNEANNKKTGNFDEEVMLLRGEIQRNEERQLALEEKIKQIHQTLETTFSLIKELIDE